MANSSAPNKTRLDVASAIDMATVMLVQFRGSGGKAGKNAGREGPRAQIAYLAPMQKAVGVALVCGQCTTSLTVAAAFRW